MRDAINKAGQWGSYLATHVPDLDTLVLTGIPSPEQRKNIRDVRQAGDIFRFKLFSATGHLVLVSDDQSITSPPGVAAEPDAEANRVAHSGMPIVVVKNGEQKPDRPDLYAEAYIPLRGQDGALRGVVKVYVDQSKTRDHFVESFKSFAVVMAVFCSVVFAVPGSAFYLQRIFAERSRKKAEYLAKYDPLTGLLNRRSFVEQAEQCIQEKSLVAVCYIDLDRFKAINDTFGHAIGDAFLTHVAQILKENSNSGDLLSRFGGDEFVIGFCEVPLDEAIQTVRNILKECARKVELGAISLEASVSIGVVAVEEAGSLEVILNNADAALYFAKNAGRNDFAIYGEEMGDELRRRHGLETRLREATLNKEFDVHYQPLVRSADQAVIGYEALLRLKDHDGNQISPSDFIPMAEETGLIEEIGRWTLQTAIGQMASLEEGKKLAINLSPTQYRSGDLVGFVQKALMDTGFPPNLLELEVTETLLLEDSMMIEMQLDTLKEMGVSIAMDDFGTGFSSLSYLWKHRFDRLKIDRSFVAALERNPERSREIIETIVLLGAKLDMEITAEGVETAAQAQLLTDLGCDVLQGYLFGRAASLEEIKSQVFGASTALKSGLQ
ncbi:putative bifunctional diguanylate cyclase/phosphodiesterase [Roseobacter sp. SK209-2-6]|uniref:putative bifunctional diguanylate cyclase/phosphodiesterase n=1 Tax=Roseobacter sp. SK209-2-6 TaxID=388739 RepID=UPI000682C10C|nr:bifunctional diguanylate cyclase/phosphodiesterase [Roseobacter sp. SK209-2-6]